MFLTKVGFFAVCQVRTMSSVSGRLSTEQLPCRKSRERADPLPVRDSTRSNRVIGYSLPAHSPPRRGSDGHCFDRVMRMWSIEHARALWASLVLYGGSTARTIAGARSFEAILTPGPCSRPAQNEKWITTLLLRLQYRSKPLLAHGYLSLCFLALFRAFCCVFVLVTLAAR